MYRYLPSTKSYLDTCQPAWLHLADGAALFRRHQVRADTGIRRAAAAQVHPGHCSIQRIHWSYQRPVKYGMLPFTTGIWLPGIGRDSRKIHVDLCARADFRAGRNCGKITAVSRRSLAAAICCRSFSYQVFLISASSGAALPAGTSAFPPSPTA